MCCYVRISSTRPAQSRPEKTKSLLVRSAGTCSKQMFAPSPECVCVLLHPVFPYVLVIHAECMFVCVRVLRPPPPFIQIHFVISATSSTLLLQRSVTEHLLYSDLLMSDPPERGGDEEAGGGEEGFRGSLFIYLFLLLFTAATCAVLRDVKRRPRAEAPRLALISIAITPQTRTHTKISDALAGGGTHPNMPPQTQETVLTAHTTACLPFSIPSTKKKRNKWVSSVACYLGESTHSFHYSLSSPLLSSRYFPPLTP